MLFNSIKEMNRLSKEINSLLSHVFNSIKEINSLRKEINRFLSKGMSKYLLNSYCEDFLKTSNVLRLKSLSPGQFWGALTHTDIILKLLVAT